MPAYTDQIGNSVFLQEKPKRIISLVPSQTELLVELGLEKELIGITKFCVHPEHIFRSKTRVGGTKKIDFKKVRALQPDLIIANKEENEKDQIIELSKEFPVWVSDIHNLHEAYDMILHIGEMTGKEREAQDLRNRISNNFKRLTDKRKSKGKSVLYMIWKDPYMCAGKGTFINEMLKVCSLENIIHAARYPEIDVTFIKSAAPDYIFLSSEPYPFKEKHIKEFQEISPSSKVIIVDGEMFSWYGSRLLYAPEYFKNLLEVI